MAKGRFLKVPLHLGGWEFEGPIPTDKKYVCLAWPHTSNWDGLLLVALAKSIGLKMSWMIKSEWVESPMGVFLRPLGAVAIDRNGVHNVVSAMVEELGRCDELALVIPPEGTRRRMETWKSGFYHIARGASVPVVPGYLDYRRKRAGLGPAIHLTGNVKSDMDEIRAFYTRMAPVGRVPARVGPMRLRDENA